MWYYMNMPSYNSETCFKVDWENSILKDKYSSDQTT